jgi:type VI secretion system secreted protein VgrG
MTNDQNLYNTLLGGYGSDPAGSTGSPGGAGVGVFDPTGCGLSGGLSGAASPSLSANDVGASRAVSQALVPLATSVLSAPAGTLTKDRLVGDTADFLSSARTSGLSDDQFGHVVRSAIDFLAPFDDDTPDPVLRAATGQMLVNHLGVHAQAQALAGSGGGPSQDGANSSDVVFESGGPEDKVFDRGDQGSTQPSASRPGGSGAVGSFDPGLVSIRAGGPSSPYDPLGLGRADGDGAGGDPGDLSGGNAAGSNDQSSDANKLLPNAAPTAPQAAAQGAGPPTASGGARLGRAPRLGDLSMVYETGMRPGQETAAAAKVSTGVDDPGGVSYGAYQLASSKVGGRQVQAFLKRDGAPWAAAFAGLDPSQRGGAFQKKWEAIARSDPKFFDAQHNYIKETHYDPLVRRVAATTGIDINNRSPAVQNAVWSMSVNHGRARQLVTTAINSLRGRISPSNPGYDRALINQLYSVRRAYVVEHHQAKLLKRYNAEQPAALAMLSH